MPRNTKLAIVPAYNESGSIARVVSAIKEATPDFDVVVIDD
ncbi:MAG: glycosyltransferase, partial [Solirubrobacterales bacterium]